MNSGPAISPTPAPGRRGAAISAEPLINAAHRHLPEAAVAAFAAMVVYVSFVPLEFRSSTGSGAGGPARVWGLALRPINLPDILANLALYLPLGVGLYAVVRRRGRGRILAGTTTLVVAALLSFGVEYAQNWIAVRVATWVDFASNVLGAAIGVVLAAICEPLISGMISAARAGIRANGWLALAKAFVCLVLLVQLRPYDVVVDVVHTAAVTVRQGKVDPFARWNELRNGLLPDPRKQPPAPAELARARDEYLLDRVVDTVLHAGVAALVAAGLAGQIAGQMRPYLSAGFVTVSLGAMVVVLRIFLISHGLDTAPFLCALVGWPVGCAAAAAALRHSRGKTGAHHPVAWPGPIPCAAGAISVGLALAYQLLPVEWEPTPPALASRLNLIPFLLHFNSRPNDALSDISGELLSYGVIAACAALFMRSHSRLAWRAQAALVLVLATGLAMALQAVHLFMPSRHPDLTTPLLAAMAAGGAVVAVRWVHDYRDHIAVRVVEDPLTAQLIEGETYDKSRAIPPGSPRTDASRTDQVGSLPPG
jgi:VanZ family protein